MKSLLAGSACLLFALHSAVAAEQQAAYIFVSRLDAAAYEKAVAGLPQRRIDPEVVKDSPFPTWGVLVSRVTPNSQASRAGLTAGTIIDGLNGAEYHYHKQGLDPDANGKRVVSAVTPDGVHHDFNFKPGIIGTSSGKGYLSEQYLFQNIPRGKWDRDMLVAALAFQQSDHALAEAALQRAGAAGMPPSIFTTYFGALLALDHGEAALSRKMMEDLLKQLPSDRKKISRFFFPGLATLTFAFQNFDLLEPVLADREGMENELQPDSIQSWKAWAKSGPHESLLKRAIANAGDNVMQRVIPVSDNWHEEYQMMDPDPLRRDNHTAWLPPTYYDHRPFAPPVPFHDAIWETRVAVGDGGDFKSTQRISFNNFSLSLIDRAGKSDFARESPDRDGRTVASFDYYHDSSGERYVRFTGGPASGDVETYQDIPLLNADELRGAENRAKSGQVPLAVSDPHFVTVTIIRLGDEVEILLDRHPVLHIPIDPKVGELAFLLHANGTSFVVSHMSLRPIYPAKLNPSAEKE
ncbi:MAG: hypothetical protein ABIS50_12010 [Luteolibacter sp.]|uniref:hypothetical protein n=1 Tax=Luteolibacter sp. TaxID=1962973 RepID=UPI003263902A